MSGASPKISVVMPACDAAAYLREAIDSVLGQSLDDFEFLIIDDGSRDDTSEIAASYRDRRIRIVRHDRNLGLVASLNEGLCEARGMFIARMDADDVSLPRRFELQAGFLDSNPTVGICGTWARRFGADRRLIETATKSEAIRAELVFHSAFVHPSVMFRAELLRAHDLHYRGEVPIEDYALWRDACECFPTANLPTVLLRYRVHSTSITGRSAGSEDVKKTVRDCDAVALRRLGIEASSDELLIHDRLRSSSPAPPDVSEPWLRRLRDANRVVNFYARDDFDRAIAGRWFHVCNMASGWGTAKLMRWRESPLSRTSAVSARDVARFLVRRR